MDEVMPHRFKPYDRQKPDKPYDYGFSAAFGPDSNSRFRRFRNVEPSCHGSQVQEEPEPLVDVIEEGEEVVVVAELPRVKKEDIHIHAYSNNLVISVDTPERKYHQELTLPAEIDSKSSLATYKNGVLQVRLRKIADVQVLTK